MDSKLAVAIADSDRTTYLVDEAIKISENEKVLITTHTNTNKDEIISKFYDKNSYIPPNITIQTWSSFLLQHGVRPYQNFIFEPKIKGVCLDRKLSAKYTHKEEIEKYYFNEQHKIYSNKIAEFSVECNKYGGEVIKRLSRIYRNIFVDEMRDASFYDIEFLQLLCGAKINILVVVDSLTTVFKK